MNNWHLRAAVTSACPFRCVYCNSNNKKVSMITKEEIFQVIDACKKNKIKRVHFTGGEPTAWPYLLDAVKYAKSKGFSEQIISTNGYATQEFYGKLIKAGLQRFNVSMDTLDSKKFQSIVGIDCLDRVKSNIEYLTNNCQTVKINCVIMKENIQEIPSLIEFCESINNNSKKGKLILRLIQFYPSNPNQLEEEGQKFFRQQYIKKEDILHQLPNYVVKEEKTVGDNPSFEYFHNPNRKTEVGLLSMFENHYHCGSCYKLRLTPTADISVCLGDDKLFNVRNKTDEEVCDIIKSAISYRENIIERLPRKHYRETLGSLRFGDNNVKMEIKSFYKMVNEKLDD